MRFRAKNVDTKTFVERRNRFLYRDTNSGFLVLLRCLQQEGGVGQMLKMKAATGTQLGNFPRTLILEY